VLSEHLNDGLKVFTGVEDCALAVSMHRGLAMVVVGVLGEGGLCGWIYDFDSALGRRCVLGHYLLFKI
jgi:hypothetical protein